MTRPRHIAAAAVAAALAVGAGAAAAQTTGPAPAPAPTPPAPPASFTFEGRGWGHGVGMSQYGARGRALAGWSAIRILRHYYQGVALATAPPRTVRVLLASGPRTAALTSATPWRIAGRRADGRPRTVRLAARAVLRLRALGGDRVALERGRRRVALLRGPVVATSPGRDRAVSWGPRRPEPARAYRGRLRAVPEGGALTLVNAVGMEDYLKGVVPREMPAGWGDDAPAALRAQAVAARSYALATMRPTAHYDVFDDTRSQVYGGRAAEDPRTSRAVDATRGRVLTYDGRVVTAFFFSTSGGETEDVENVFPGGGPMPYLRSVPDPYDRISPLHRWPDPPTFSAERLGALLGLGGPVREVRVLRRGASPRVLSALVTTRAGRRATFSGATLRARLGLRDTWFTVTAHPAVR
ncbi:SpoIID/LytB domain-containing protein [Miltoncostaea marina]|uniref:SpoIID/LytB domain-containing protein n=1 Tax=Miltoncostaea marina TaxID=2843215 RepID=UPI001C3E7851|nr:SpoIID/LytB domain-containing protein [Miltoncostaea marina]